MGLVINKWVNMHISVPPTVLSHTWWGCSGGGGGGMAHLRKMWHVHSSVASPVVGYRIFKCLTKAKGAVLVAAVVAADW